MEWAQGRDLLLFSWIAGGCKSQRAWAFALPAATSWTELTDPTAPMAGERGKALGLGTRREAEAWTVRSR